MNFLATLPAWGVELLMTLVDILPNYLPSGKSRISRLFSTGPRGFPKVFHIFMSLP